MDALRLEGIEKTFPGGFQALYPLDLSVEAGELVVLLGPSGCGKSTLLRIIAGVETPTRGRILVRGVDVTELPPQRRDIAMVFQNYALYPHMTVRENLAFGLRMRGTPAPRAAARVDEVAEMLDLTPLLERRPAQLSGGQRQRVALGRAIARQARVFLLDEPLSNLDAQLRVSTRAELARLHRALDAPMIYVTHDQEEAMTLGDRVVVLSAGRILQIGSPLEIYRRPATRFVAGFVGSPRMNLLEGRLARAGDGEAIFESLDGSLRLPWPGIGSTPMDATGAATRTAAQTRTDAQTRTAAQPGAVVLGFRPEDAEIVDLTAGGGADLVVRADVVEPLGRETLVHAFAEGASDGAALRILAGPGLRAAAGDRLGLRLRRENLHLFDAATDQRIADRSTEPAGTPAGG